MSVIAVDLDDTLYSFGQLAREEFIDLALEEGDKRLQRGAYCAWGEWRSPSDVSDSEVWARVIDRCHSPANILSQYPFDNAAEVLHDLAQDHELIYVSNRNPQTWAPTHQWLTEQGFPEGDLHCTLSDKLRIVRECQYLIDDRPKTLVQFVYDFHWLHKHGSENEGMARKAFGLYTTYNAALTDVPGIKLAPNWKLLKYYLMEEGVLEGDRVGAT